MRKGLEGSNAMRKSQRARGVLLRDEFVRDTLLLISDGFHGADEDRCFFQTFRSATEVSGALHVCDFLPFWNRVAPQLGHHDDAIKYALVALGATYHLHKTTGGRGMDTQDTFILRRYGKALSELQCRIASQAPESAYVALICCLIFICLENLRLNHKNARAHLRNGIYIIDTTVNLQQLFYPDGKQALERCEQGRISLLSDAEMRGVINYFRHAEICERLYSHDAPLTLATRLRSKTSSYGDSETLPEGFKTLFEGYQARVELNSDVMALDWEINGPQAVTSSVWTQPRIKREHESLRQRSHLVSQRYMLFLMSKHAPESGSREYASACLDMVIIKSMQAVIELMDLRDNIDVRDTPFFRDVILGGMIHFAELLHEAMNTGRHEVLSTLDLTVESSILGPIYLAYVHSTDLQQKSRARKILIETRSRGGKWDPRSLKTIVEMSKGPKHQRHEPRGSMFMALGRSSGDQDYYGLFSRFCDVVGSPVW
ncbi:uncharacterized protein Z519_05496 [Cladophialophora bantiana CBS 173.52]|uniref:Transcription factor domain-containing protein n=1 Tax=Cladophialophora bantiana (strain ATCC 10958 / CBS 173.52 / CDC B-1940 / NIH 8579) TaxID=1442370 RepID=A0A0D2HTK6_CLAB1|nr:uncharacterized protein Z519_05496 [Cladophialophora bantiana CBS 173.52]KIW94180.1 hypothetical protein Z519_05496 [Cladophialophora bantiana CBS 173.52]